MGAMRKNKNRGYQQLRVWNDAIDLFARTCRLAQPLPYDMKRAASQQIASVDSVHRNIAEGYCRRSINEYLYHLNVALGSLGESVSGLHAFKASGHLAEADFEPLDELAYRLENGLLKLVERLEEKREHGDWVDHLMVRESNAVYDASSPAFADPQYSSTPSLQYSEEPSP